MLPSERARKINLLVNSFGFESMDDAIESSMFDSVCPAVCMNPDCDYTTEYEPDSTKGHCEVCGTFSCKSILILAGAPSRIDESDIAFALISAVEMAGFDMKEIIAKIKDND